jgi:iron(III) transport system substrate-binding protein
MERKVRYLAVTFMLVILSCTLLSGLSYAEPSKDLYPLAKREGTVTCGSAVEEEMMRPVNAAFEAKYPGVKVKYIRQSSGPLMSMVETEREAGRVSFDVVQIADITDVIRLQQKGYFQSYKPENWNEIPNQYKDKDGYFTTHHFDVMLGAYNPKVIPQEEAPKSYRDLLNPKWNNKICGSSPSRGGSGLASVMRVIGLYGWEFIETLARNGTMCVAGHGTVARMVISGERPLAWDLTGYRAMEEEHKGSPLKHIWFSEGVPTFSLVQGIPLKAPHPNAGKLFLNFQMSRECQELTPKHILKYSIFPDIKPPKSFKPLDKKNSWDPPLDDFFKNGKAVADKFDQIFGLK